MTPSPVVHVIDDDEAVRESLGFLLGTAGFSVSSWPSAEAFLERATLEDDACVVTDVRMPGMSGVDLVAELRASRSRAGVVVITGHGDIPLAVQALKAGADDFLEKPFDDEAIEQAIRSALQRNADARGEVGEIAQRLGSLSARERQVLDGLVQGQPNKVIAHELGISPRTVEVYRANLMSKMQATSLSELVRFAILGDAAA
ncbi:MAG TPA: response regulator FixJ [Caulobacteraceae bacterium]